MRLSLKIARLKGGKKQGEIAAEIGVTQAYLSALENETANNPSKEVMDKLAAALGTTVQALFYEQEE